MEHGDFDIEAILKTNIFALIYVQGGRIDKSWHSSVSTCVCTEMSTNMFVCVCVCVRLVLLMLVWGPWQAMAVPGVG